MKVPWMSKLKISMHASNLLADYQAMIGHPVRPPIPAEDIIERYLKLTLRFDDLTEILGMDGVLGATYVDARLICINERLFEDNSEGRLIFTCAHEVGHWVMHRRYVEKAERGGQENGAIICRAGNGRQPIEWQADYFAACLLMPEKEIERTFHEVCGTDPLVLNNMKNAFRGTRLRNDPGVENWHFIAEMVCEAGGFTNVSKLAMIIRLQELGLLVNLTGTPIGWS